MATPTVLPCKLVVPLAFKAGGDLFHEIVVNKPHDFVTASPAKFKSCQVLEGTPGTNGCVKLWNYTLAFSEDGQRVGIGFGVWMRDGLFARHWEAVDHPLAPESAEAYAIRAAVHWAILQGWERVQVFTNCLSLVSSFNSLDFDFSVVGPVLSDIKSLASSFEFF